MKPKTASDPSRDELLAGYEEGVWTFLAIAGLALVGISIWIGFTVF